jgi:3-carboxy-cis,cis-muconate cycloisomerase
VPLLDDLDTAAEASAALARTHVSTPMAGRTLLQQAVPVTFGLVAAGWLAGLSEAAEGLRGVAEDLPAQLGGAAGTLASLGDDGPRVLAAYAAELDLAEPALAWHTLRGPIATLASALGVACGAMGKVARDVTLLAQTEVAEVREAGGAGRGGSSTMPHKRNPIAAVSALACAQQAPGLVGTLLASMVSEHQRAAGAWHAEWRPFGELLRSCGSAAAWLRECLEGLEVDTARMRENLDGTGGLLLAERVSAALAGPLGRQAAHDLIQRAAAAAASSARAFAAVLEDDEEVREHVGDVGALLDPAGYLGSAPAFVERALERYAP